MCGSAESTTRAPGSGAGITAIGNGTADFAGSDVTMTDTETAAAKPLAAATRDDDPGHCRRHRHYLQPQGRHVAEPVGETIAGIFDGKIAKWNDPAIAAENSGTTLPTTPISVFYRNDSSGSTSVFTAFLTADAASDLDARQ